MMSIETIVALNAEVGAEARELDLEPYVFSAFDLKNLADGDLYPLRRIPNLGDWTPDGWTEVERYFVDKSGFGRDGEPALTAQKFAKRIKPGLGFGIVEEGQFQIYIAAFAREDS